MKKHCWKQEYTKYLPFIPFVNRVYLLLLCFRMLRLRLFSSAKMFPLVLRLFSVALAIAIIRTILLNANPTTVVSILESLWVYGGISYAAYYLTNIINEEATNCE